MDLAQVISGFAVGTIVGITGVGGGALMTPLLLLVFGIAPATAVGTDLLFAAITKSGGTWVHARQGTVDWRVVRLLASGSLPATALTLLVVHSAFPGGLSGARQLIGATLGVALLLTAAALIYRRHLLALREKLVVREHPAATIATGAVLGALVSVSSVGAGALGVTALLFLHPKLATPRIVGTDIAHAVPLALVAGLGHWWLGSIDWTLLATLLAGSLPGIWFGSRLAPRIPERFLRTGLAGMLILIGGKLIAA
ncbi:MAG: sulfite exporter TauE/SafE family protein [Rhodocyclales bacterium]|nr:sulfite exporter TauE/SafE family protein [Rhodocyclales bacterium]